MEMTRTKKAIYIIRDAEDVKHLPSSGLFEIYAWTPAAVDALRSMNISYITRADFAQKPVKDEITSWANEFVQWAHALDDLIQNKLTSFKDLKLHPVQASMHSIRKAFFHLRHQIEKLYELHENALEINIFCNSDNESDLLMDVLKKQTHMRNFKLIPRKTPFIEQDLDSYLVHWFFPRNTLKVWAKAFLNRDGFVHWPGLYESFLNHKFGHRQRVLVLSQGFDGPDILNDLATNSDVRIHQWNKLPVRNKPVPINLNSLKDEISAVSKGCQWHWYRDVDVWSLVSNTILNKWTADFPRMLAVAKDYIYYMERFSYDLIFTSFALTEYDVIFDISKRYGTPFVMPLHGGTIGVYSDMPPMPTCWRGPQSKAYYLTYTPAIKKLSDEYKIKLKTYTVSNEVVGSPYFENLERISP